MTAAKLTVVAGLVAFAGVPGGLISFGMIGIFVGPVVLAVTHTLAKARAWERAGPWIWRRGELRIPRS